MKNNLEKLLRTFICFDYSRQTTDLFYRWILGNDPTGEKEKAFRQLWSKTKGQSTINIDKSFQQVLDKVGVKHAPMVRMNRWSVWKPVAAATVILFLSVTATLWISHDYFDKDNVAMVEYYVKNGQRRDLHLPDGTVVHLNSSSHVFYPRNLEGKTRTIYLVGEASFNVAKDPKKPFIVRSANMEIRAIGTEFNVKAYSEEDFITATLIEGKVRVNCNDTTSYVLTPGQQVLYTKSTLKTRLLEADIDDVTAWQRGEVVLCKATVSEIAEVLKRRYGITFHISGKRVSQDQYNFVFKESADIKEVLEVMRVVIGEFDYQLTGNICYIHWK